MMSLYNGHRVCFLFFFSDLYFYITNIYKFLLSQGLYIKPVLYSKVLIIQPKWDYQNFRVTSIGYGAKQIVLLMEVHSEVHISFINDYSTG